MANLNSAKFNLSGYNKALTKVVTGYFCLACHDYFDKKKVEEERGKERKREKSEKIYIFITSGSHVVSAASESRLEHLNPCVTSFYLLWSPGAPPGRDAL